MPRRSTSIRITGRGPAATDRMGRGIAASALATGCVAVVALWKSASAGVANGSGIRS